MFVLATMSGCASRYHEPPASEKRIAYLNAAVPVWIVSIDDQKVSSFGISGQKQLKILPGAHVVEVEFHYDQLTLYGRVSGVSKHSVRIKFVALPGTTYYVQDGRVGNRWRPYVTDTLEPKFSDVKLN